MGEVGETIKCCGTCAFAKPEGAQFVCRRFPPIPFVIHLKDYNGVEYEDVANRSPTVAFDWWCGEHDFSVKYKMKG